MCANLCNSQCKANDLGSSEKGTEAAVACETEEGTETQSGSGSAIGGVSVTRFGQQRERPYQFWAGKMPVAVTRQGQTNVAGSFGRSGIRVFSAGESGVGFIARRRPCRSTELLTRLLSSR